ncbi:GNAT family N-acetyltransferase [Nocardia sp. CA-107356]|uniref:GNAT family N-acetyltransferase n=1 Tax=Nocardia sp. CA-107356 TaxID=3239972 RepID=UPI003D94A1C3
MALYVEVNWWPKRTAADIAHLLTTGPAVGAWHHDELLGFARAITDGVCRAYVEDVIVAVDHRNKGIGRRLNEALIVALADIPVVSLFCGESLVDFYVGSGIRFTRQRVEHRTPAAATHE